MAEPIPDVSPTRPPERRFLPLLLVLFFGSGCAALIYEIVWFQMLQLVIGSSAVSLGVLLGTFMGGMCLGSLALPRLISARRHPLRVYGLLELGIGIIGILVLFGMPYVDRVYIAYVGHGLPGILLRGVVCAVCLLPPTLLMGATLPAIARWVDTTPQGISWLGFFYGGNIAGAVFGCLLAGFYLLRVHDMAMATYVAVILNGSLALISLTLENLTPHSPPASDAPPAPAAGASGLWPVYVVIALSGMSALGAEVVWTRLLSLLIGATVYTFSIILAVFLFGLGIGSSAGSLMARETVRPRLALGVCQMLLAAAIAWAAFMLSKSLPYWPINPSLSLSPWYNFQLDLTRCMWAIFPAACCWGASFPLALAVAASRGQDPGRLVGGVYAANTVGAIIGALGFSMIIVPWAGTQQAQRLLIALASVAVLLMMAPLLWPFKTPGSPSRRVMGPAIGIGTAVAGLGLAALLIWSVCGVPWELIAYGRRLPTMEALADVLYMGEGMNSSVAVSRLDSGVRNFHVSGKIEASSEPQDMRLQRMLGHLPALIHPAPRSVLIVGCGAGVTAGCFVLHPSVEKIVICEIEPLIPKVVSQYFIQENYDVVKDPRVRLVYDDARHYVLTTREKFDIITSDPIHPWVKGAATLYTKEYFELCKQHLNPGGLVTQWVPLYQSDERVVKSELATFFDVFPDGTVWGNDVYGKGYDIVLLGQAGKTRINVDDLHQRLSRHDHASVAQSLTEVELGSAVELLATYAGQGPDLRPWLNSAEINRDRNLHLQYLAGMGVNANQSEGIYKDMLEYRKFPESLFGPPSTRRQIVKIMLERARPKP